MTDKEKLELCLDALALIAGVENSGTTSRNLRFQSQKIANECLARISNADFQNSVNGRKEPLLMSSREFLELTESKQKNTGKQ